MKRRQAFRTLALAVLVALAPGLARASGIRDQAELFDSNVLQRAERELDRLESSLGLPVTVETVPSLKGESVEDVAMRLARQSGATGLFILISKQEHKIDLRVSQHFSHALNDTRVRAIRESFIKDFKKGDYNAGLLAGVTTVEREAKSAAAANGGRLDSAPRGRPGGRVIARAPAPVGNPRGGFGIGSLLGLGLLILAVLFVVRLVGSLMGGGAPMMGGPGPRMGMGGPGYGPGPGYGYGGGGGGGGFWSSVFGGLGGAIAGNWIYDQFSGRHHGGYGQSTSYDPGYDQGADPGTSPDTFEGGTHVSGDWGGDSGGGGGDWGGGGGDWGGGGGGGGDFGTGGDW